MKIEELFSGVAVIIDDEIEDKNANIAKIVTQIESKKIPVLKYKELPEDETVSHFQNLSFVLLDWKLTTGIAAEDLEQGVQSPEGLQEGDTVANLTFIKNLNRNCFCPIFLFTNEDVSSIEPKLEKEGLMAKNKSSNLFVKSKSELQDDEALFKEVSEWVEKTPSVYVLKEWEKEYQNCKTKLFSEFHSIHPSWPTIMWENFEADKSREMGELISKNLHSRMTPFKFKDDILNRDSDIPSRNELRKVLEGERFLKAESLHEDDIGTGDLFKEKYSVNGEDKVRYYLNIRAQCDLLRKNNPDLFLISGYILEQNKKGTIKDFHFNRGEYIEKSIQAVVAFIDDGKIIEFKFSKFKIEPWCAIKCIRVGRLLPPYINRIQQRYSLYMQRQGLPRIPDEAIFENSSRTGNTNE